LTVSSLGSRAAGESDAASAIRVALERGAQSAVALLGKPGGFLDNPKVRIPLPGYLESAAPMLKLAGQQKRLDELVVSMNRAAEQAVPEAKTLLEQAVRSMSIEDAQRIVSGGDDSATRFFAEKTRQPLTERFLPIVTRETEKVALAQQFNEIAGKAGGLGLVKGSDANVQQYVTSKALDGLYRMIGEEEKRIRQDPVGTGSALLKQVFGGR
jgi:hypothetical protein